MNASGILLLGASGLVGGQLLKCFAAEGYAPIHALSRHAAGELSGVTYHQTSLDDADVLRRVLPECAWVIHAASDSTPGSSALRPLFEAEHNLLPSLRFLQVLQDYPHVRLIYLSTGGALYGNPDPSFSLMPENLCAAPLSYYGAGKAALEQFIIAFCNQQQRPGIILRPANFYGPGQPCKPGFGIVPTIFQRLLQNQPIQIWGDGEAVRDYLYIDDFIGLCATLIASPRSQAGAAIYNVGSQQGISLNQLCALIEEVTGIPFDREYHASRAVDVRRIVLDCRRIQADYGWQATTGLRTGLRCAWDWFSAQTGSC